MVKRIWYLWVAALLWSACSSLTGAHQNGEIEVDGAWVRAGLKDGNSAVYMILKNHSGMDDALVGAYSESAGAVELHLSEMGDDGTMRMIPQESIELPSGTEVPLKPGSYHIMLIGLAHDLLVDGEITLRLDFDLAEDVTLSIPVREADAMGGSGMDGHNHMP